MFFWWSIHPHRDPFAAVAAADMRSALPVDHFRLMVGATFLHIMDRAHDRRHVRLRPDSGPRRRCTLPILYTRPPAARDMRLRRRIIETELPNVVARCLAAYRRLLEDGGGDKSFWAICPRYPAALMP